MAARGFVVLGVAAAAAAMGCRDVRNFSTGAGHHYEGTVVAGNFVRTGVADATKACVALDADHLQDAPGTLSTSDGRFVNAALRPIPQIWHDPLSTLQFGEGRAQNLLYVVSPQPTDAAGGDGCDVTVIVSLMDDGNLELRLLRGAPADAAPPALSPIFGVFALDKRDGACSF